MIIYYSNKGKIPGKKQESSLLQLLIVIMPYYKILYHLILFTFFIFFQYSIVYSIIYYSRKWRGRWDNKFSGGIIKSVFGGGNIEKITGYSKTKKFKIF